MLYFKGQDVCVVLNFVLSNGTGNTRCVLRGICGVLTRDMCVVWSAMFLIARETQHVCIVCSAVVSNDVGNKSFACV